MNRNKILANQVFFTAIDNFCIEKFESLNTSGKDRFIKPSSNSSEVLIRAELATPFILSNGKAIQPFVFENEKFFFCVNFTDISGDNIQDMIEEVDSNGFFTLSVNNLKLRPVVTWHEIVNIVDVGSIGDQDYDGHELNQIQKLYDPARLFRFIGAEEETFWFCILHLCLEEAYLSNSWIEEPLAKDLSAFGGLDYDNVPYEIICRGVFDSTPRGLFISLYQCLEGLYSRKKALSIINEFDLKDNQGRPCLLYTSPSPRD